MREFSAARKGTAKAKRADPSSSAERVVQRKPATVAAAPQALHEFRKMTPAVAAGALRPSGNGGPLPNPVRGHMESVFDADLSDVRLHINDKPSLIGARAYAQGSHIHLSPDLAQPDRGTARNIMGHEIAHVLQQRENRVATGPMIDASPALEAEADRFGARAMNGRSSPRPAQLQSAGSRAPSLPAGAPIQPFWWKNGTTYQWVHGTPDEDTYKMTNETKMYKAASHPVYRLAGTAAAPLEIVGHGAGKGPTARPTVTAKPVLPWFRPSVPPKGAPKLPSGDGGQPAPPSITAPHQRRPPPPKGGAGAVASLPALDVKVPENRAPTLPKNVVTIAENAPLSGPAPVKPELRPKSPPSLTNLSTPSQSVSAAAQLSTPSPSDEKSMAQHVAPPALTPPSQQDSEPINDEFLAMAGTVEDTDDKTAHVPTRAAAPSRKELNKLKKLAKAKAQPPQPTQKNLPEAAAPTVLRGAEQWMDSVSQTSLYPPVNAKANDTFLTRHHINPKRQLAEFYNRAAARGHLAALDPLMQTVIGHHEARRNQFASNSEAKDVKQEDLLEEWKHLQTPRAAPKNRVAARTLEEMYQWFPGNLMVGPSSDRRIDDPRSGFESDAKSIVDRDAPSDRKADHRTAFEHHQAASEAMARYLDPWDAKDEKSGKADEAQRAHAKAAADHLTAAAKFRSADAYPYDEKQWEKIADGAAPEQYGDGNEKPKKEWKIKKKK